MLDIHKKILIAFDKTFKFENIKNLQQKLPQH